MSNYWSNRFPQPLFFSIIALIVSCVMVLLVIKTFVFAADDLLINYSVFKTPFNTFNVFITLYLQSISVFKTCSNPSNLQINALFSVVTGLNIIFFTQNQVLAWFFVILSSLLLLLFYTYFMSLHIKKIKTILIDYFYPLFVIKKAGHFFCFNKNNYFFTYI